MRRLGVFLLSGAVATLLMLPVSAQAQQQPALGNVVATCGTPNSTYAAGDNRPLTQDITGTLCSQSGGGGSGGAVWGPNAVGVAAAHPPVIIGGTADATATGTVQVLKVDSSGNGYVTISAQGSNGAASPTKSILVGVSDGTNLQQLIAPIDLTDGVNGNNMIANGNYVYNGASWDRMPGSAAGGVSTTVLASALPSGAATESTLSAAKTDLDTISGAVGSPIPAPTTSVASTSYGLQSAASTNATSVKASAGVLAGMNLINTTTTIYYLRMYNLAAAPTCSSATGFVRTWPIPPAAASGGAGGIAVHLPVNGSAFSTGIAFCLTGGPTSTDNTNAATGVFVNLDYY